MCSVLQRGVAYNNVRFWITCSVLQRGVAYSNVRFWIMCSVLEHGVADSNVRFWITCAVCYSVELLIVTSVFGSHVQCVIA